MYNCVWQCYDLQSKIQNDLWRGKHIVSSMDGLLTKCAHSPYLWSMWGTVGLRVT